MDPAEIAAKLTPFVAVPSQFFRCHQDWVNRASRCLTSHPKYRNTSHLMVKGWRGYDFVAMCFDQKGRRCLNGGDFQRAADDGAFPVWWIWPDQIAELIMGRAVLAALDAKEAGNG